MRALVTGAAGFVGRYLSRSLLGRGMEVFATDIPQLSAQVEAGAMFRACDIRDIRQVRALFQEVRPEQVYHLAGLVKNSLKNSLDDFEAVHQVNFWGTCNVLEAVRCITPSAKVLLVSSGHAYAPAAAHELPITESHPFGPKSPYALSKASADLLGFYYYTSAELHVMRARPFNHTGPGQPPAYVCSDFARQIAAIELGLKAPEMKVGNVQSRRDFSDVRDVVHAYELLMEKGRPGEAYNVGAGAAVSVEEILEILRGLCTRPVTVITETGRLRPGEVSVMYGSILKVRSETGWSPQIPLERTLADLLEYWRERLRSEGAN